MAKKKKAKKKAAKKKKTTRRRRKTGTISASDLSLSIRLRRQLDRDFEALDRRLSRVIAKHKSYSDIGALRVPLRRVRNAVRRLAWGV